MAAHFEVPAFPSQSQSSDSSGSSDEDEYLQEEVKRRGKNYQYIAWQRFESKELFEQWWTGEKKNRVLQYCASNTSEMAETWYPAQITAKEMTPNRKRKGMPETVGSSSDPLCRALITIP